MRISDWSSDVCSSDLLGVEAAQPVVGAEFQNHRIGIIGQRPVEPRQAAGGGVAGVAGVEHHDVETVGAQRRFELFRKGLARRQSRSEDHTSELQSLMRISYAVFCLKKKTTTPTQHPSPS